MEIYRLKRPYISIVIPLFGLLSLFCFYPQVKTIAWIMIIPILIIIYGSFIVYKKITYRVHINDSNIEIANKNIPWKKVKKVISYKQMVENGSSIRKVNRLTVIYETEDNKKKTICITPQDMDKPIAIVNSIKKRIEITVLQ